jgi:hypothetical protein
MKKRDDRLSYDAHSGWYEDAPSGGQFTTDGHLGAYAIHQRPSLGRRATSSLPDYAELIGISYMGA